MTSMSRSLQDNFWGENSEKSIKYSQIYDVVCQLALLGSKGLNKSLKKRKMSPTIHRKYQYFHSTVQTAEDEQQKFHFYRLSSDVTSCLISLMSPTIHSKYQYKRPNVEFIYFIYLFIDLYNVQGREQ